MRRKQIKVGHMYKVRLGTTAVGGAEYSGRLGMESPRFGRAVVVDPGWWSRRGSTFRSVGKNSAQGDGEVAVALLIRGTPSAWRPAIVHPREIQPLQ